VRGLLGRGGFAEVYQVWDRELERQLAIKVLRPDIAWTSGMLERFKRETRVVAKLQHPNILPIHFVGEGEGLVYYAMPHLEGESLSSVLRNRGSLSPQRAVGLAIPTLQALQHAHEHGLVHRDIKPDNIMVERSGSRPVLMDFGIAKQLDADGGLTQTGFVVGTPYYMSPEQALGQGELDARSDIYSFGAVLFQMITGVPPFDGDSSQEIVGKHIAEPPPNSADLNSDVPLWLSHVVGRCLAKKPDDRFQSAASVVEVLEAGRDTVSSTTTPVQSDVIDADADTEVVEQLMETEVISTGRRRWAALISLGLMAGTVAIIAGWWLTAPRLLFDNALRAPVRLSLAGDQHLVEPGDQISLRLPREGSSGILWTLVRPTNDAGDPLGVEVIGAIAVTDPHGRTRATAEATTEERAYFAPLITNETGEPLSVTVNATTPRAETCDCIVPVGAVRMLIGYYPLFSNSTVRVEDSSGRLAMFVQFSSEVNRRSGVVSLKFQAKDLRPVP
jgi:hypothetical protein